MKYDTLILEKKEYVILKRALNLSGYHHDHNLRKSVEKLLKQMESAQIYDEAEMPDGVVRLNSVVTVVSQNGWRKRFQLVLPKENDVKTDKISLLTPMGTSVMGYSEGDSYELELPSRLQQLTIEKVAHEKKYINLIMEP